MRKLVSILAVSVLVCGLTVAGEIGPPEPVNADGEVPISVSMGYSRYSGVFKPNSSQFGMMSGVDDILRFGDASLSGERIYTQVNVAIPVGDGLGLEGYARLGLASLGVENMVRAGGHSGSLGAPNVLEAEFADIKFSDRKMKPYTTMGIKGLLYENGNVGIGPFMEASLFSNYWDRRSDSIVYNGYKETYQITQRWRDMWDVTAGLAAQIRIEEALVYGGPFLYHSAARARVKAEMAGYSEEELNGQGWEQDYSDSISTSRRFHEKGNVGGFLGMRVPLPGDMQLAVEGRYRSAFSWGFSLAKAF